MAIIYIVLPCCGYRTFQRELPPKEGSRVSIECPHGKLIISWEEARKDITLSPSTSESFG